MNERIRKMVEIWESAAEKPAPEQLCANCPELLTELKEAIAALNAADGLLNDAEMTQAADNSAMHSMAIGIPGYKVVHRVGHGGQAVVYAAIKENTGRKVAVKVLHQGSLLSSQGRARFDREVSILANLNHPNIVTVIDRGVTPDGSLFIVMDFVEGMPLDKQIAAWTPGIDPTADTVGLPDRRQMLVLFSKICDAVQAAHEKGVIHRDLKPNNILIDNRGEPHILDFGLARSTLSDGDYQHISITEQFLGTLAWASPEQADGRELDQRTDVYSLGLILYYMLTGGKFPYSVLGPMAAVLDNIRRAQPIPPSQVLAPIRGRRDRGTGKYLRPVPPLNKVIESIVLTALSKKAADRYSNAGELGRQIRNYLAGSPVAWDANPPRRVPPKTLMAGLLLGGIIVLVGAVVIGRHMRGVVARSPETPPSSTEDVTARKSALAATQPTAVVPSTSATVTRLTGKPLFPSSTPWLVEPPFRVDAEGHRVVDLMPLVDVRRGCEADNSVSGLSGDGLLTIPYDPPEEYDYVVEFDFNKFNNSKWYPSVVQLLTHGGHQFSWSLSRGGQDVSQGLEFGFGDISGKNSYEEENPTHILKRGRKWEAGHSYSSTVRVRNGGVAGYLDDELISQYVADYAVFDQRAKRHLDVYQGGIGLMMRLGLEINKVEIVEITGKGHLHLPLPDDANLVAMYPEPEGVNAPIRKHVVEALRFSTDGRLVSRTGSSFTSWDRNSGEVKLHHTGINFMSHVSPDGQYFVWSEMRATHVGEIGKSEHLLPRHIRSAAFLSDGKRIVMDAVVDASNTDFSIWDWEHAIEIHHAPEKGGLLYATNGGKILRLAQGEATFWDADGLKKLWSIRQTSFISFFASFSPDGTLIAITPGSGAAVIDAVEGKIISTCTLDAPSQMAEPRFSPNGRFVLLFNHDGGPVDVFDAKSGVALKRFSTPIPSVISADWSPDGKCVLAGCRDGTMRLFDFATGKIVQVFTGHVGPVWAVTFSPDGKFVASSCNDENVRVFKIMHDVAVAKLPAAREALEQEERFRLAHPTPDNARNLWSIYGDLAAICLTTGDYPAARRYLESRLALVSKPPTPDQLKELPKLYAQLGHACLMTNDTESAKTALLEGLKLDHANAGIKRGLADLYADEAEAKFKARRNSDARALLEEAATIYVELNAADPRDAKLRQATLGVLQKLGDMALQRGDATASQGIYKQYADIAQKAADAAGPDFKDPDIVENVLVGYEGLSDASIELKDVDTTTYCFDKYKQIIESRFGDKTSAPARHALAVAYGKLGVFSQKRNALTEAKQYFDKEIKTLDDLPDADRFTLESQTDLSQALRKYAVICTMQKEIPAAIAAFKRAVEVDENLSQRHLGNQDLRRNASVSNAGLGDATFRLGRPEPAKPFFDRALELAQAAATIENTAENKLLLAKSLRQCGFISLKLKDLPAATKFYHDALAIDEPLSAAAPDDTDVKLALARDLVGVGLAARSAGDDKTAIDSLTRARDIVAPQRSLKSAAGRQAEEEAVEINSRLDGSLR